MIKNRGLSMLPSAHRIAAMMMPTVAATLFVIAPTGSTSAQSLDSKGSTSVCPPLLSTCPYDISHPAWFTGSLVSNFVQIPNTSSIPIAGQYDGAIRDLNTTFASTPERNRIDEQFFFPVQINAGGSQSYNVWGELRSPASPQNRTLLILVSGITYDHRYWDFPSGPSFVDAAVNQGYAVLNVDKLGTGYSSRPPAAELGYQQDVFVLHQLVTAVKTGSLKRFGFSRVVLVGHSLGSTLIIPESATYNDVDAIVLTGITHTAGDGLNQFFSDVIPVTQDASLSMQAYPADYYTLKAGSLGPLFFNPATSVPSLIATNESIKTTFTLNEATIPQLLAAHLGENKITVPVLTVFGAKDILFGNTGTEQRLQIEPTFYPKSPVVNVFAIPETGHALALSETAPLTNEIIFQWLHRNVDGDSR